MRKKFLLDPDLCFLNHGSFGACPREVMEHAEAQRRELERDPVQFLTEGGAYETRAQESKLVLGRFLGADPRGLALVPNATTAANVVARSLRLAPDDEVLVSDHDYRACLRAMEFTCRQAGARLTRATVRLPVADPGEVTAAYEAAITPRTRLILASHIASPTALIFPVEQLVALGRARGIPVFIDGAHAPGHVPLDLDRLGADFYAGNCHKWLFAPKSAGFLYVRADRREEIQPWVVGHGWPPAKDDPRGRIGQLFDWPGTFDPGALLAVPAAIAFVERIGLARIREHGHGLMRRVYAEVSALTSLPPLYPDDPRFYACMVSLPLPATTRPDLRQVLLHKHRIQIVTTDTWGPRLASSLDSGSHRGWATPGEPYPGLLLRVCGAIYNTESDVDRLMAALTEELR